MPGFSCKLSKEFCAPLIPLSIDTTHALGFSKQSHPWGWRSFCQRKEAPEWFINTLAVDLYRSRSGSSVNVVSSLKRHRMLIRMHVIVLIARKWENSKLI